MLRRILLWFGRSARGWCGGRWHPNQRRQRCGSPVRRIPFRSGWQRRGWRSSDRCRLVQENCSMEWGQSPIASFRALNAAIKRADSSRLPWRCSSAARQSTAVRIVLHLRWVRVTVARQSMFQVSAFQVLVVIGSVAVFFDIVADQKRTAQFGSVRQFTQAHQVPSAETQNRSLPSRCSTVTRGLPAIWFARRFFALLEMGVRVTVIGPLRLREL